MGIISRFADIMSANINELLDRFEDPSKMIDQCLRDLTEDLAKVKEETAGIMAEEKRAKRIYDEALEEVEKYADLAKKALAAGNEGDARVFLTKKQSLEANLADVKKTYDIAHANAEKMREMHDKLTNDINELEARRQNVKAKVAVAKTQERLNKISDTMDTASGSMRAFERMEAKADQMLDRANSMAELNAEPVDDADSLAEKYAAGTPSSVDDELAKFKAEMGL